MTTTTAPIYDPYDWAVHEDPFPIYARLREEAPLYRNDDVGFWALSRHADVAAAFRDSARYSSSHGVTIDPMASGPHAHKTMSFLAMDPPRHTRMRGLVARGFTPRRVAELEPRIREITRAHLDEALARADDDGSGEIDMIGDLAARLPMDVVSELLGVPEADRAELRRKSDLLVHRPEGSDDVPPEAVEAAAELFTYYAAMVGERRDARTDDLVSALCDAEIDGERLDDEEIIAFLFLMVVAGNETTTKLIGNAWWWAWRNPAERAKVWAEPARVGDWVEETLRYDTSTQMLARITTTDVEVAGGMIPDGDRVLLLIGSANRDPRVFPEPDRFDLDRDTSSSLSFGMGRHFCMGASLARLEARVALEEVVARIADYDVDAERSERVHSVNVRGFAALPSRVEVRS